jgi:hypothetical protein
MRVLVLFLVGSWSLAASAVDFRHSTRTSPGDYLLRSLDQHQDNIFDSYRTIDLGASIGVGSDCGQIDFTSTLRASLKNLLDSKYFANIGQNIIASSPMLLACYFSPTWCAILKHSQVGAHYLSQMRLDQCSVIDKYVDSRVEDFYQERQSCVRKAIEANNGDMEHAMETCQGNKLWDVDLSNWAGKRNGEKVTSNKLLESSAKWAGFEGQEAEQSLNLVKALVGDTVVSRGGVSVEYGPRQSALTPRTYLQSIEKGTYQQLCGSIVRRIQDAGPETVPDKLVTDSELKALSPGFAVPLIDRQTLRALSVMAPLQRQQACKSLSDALSMTLFSTEMNRSLDMLTTLAQNPNLPSNRKQEIEQKRRALKDSLDAAVSMQRQRSSPLNAALSKINESGAQAYDQLTREALSTDADRDASDRVRAGFLDCADGVMCERRGN